jgi:hypothetical protein
MDFGLLERRRDPRTQAFVPVTVRCHDLDEETPAHLLDLSNSGAGILATAYHAPAVGQYLDLRFEAPNNDGASDTSTRYETGIVVNSATPERGIARLGIRFLQHRRIGSGLFDPNDTLSGYRKRLPTEEQGRRWDLECLFRGRQTTQMAGAAN